MSNLTVGYARSLLQITARNAGISAYSPQILDVHLKTAFMAMLERTQLGYLTITVPVGTMVDPDTGNNYSFDIAEVNSDFLDSRFICAMIANKVMKVYDFPTLARKYDQSASLPLPTGEPREIGFYNHTFMYVYPDPDQVYDMQITFRSPLVTWTDGATDSDTLATVINMPEEPARDSVIFGAAYFLESSNKEMAASTTARYKDWQDKLAFWTGHSNQQTGTLITRPSLPWASQSGYYNANFPGSPLY